MGTDSNVAGTNPAKRPALRLAVVVGHSKASPGAVSLGGYSEWGYNCTVAETLVEFAAQRPGEVTLKVFYRTGTGYRGPIGRVIKSVNAWGADLCLALHFNASTNPRAHGATALFWPGSRKGRIWAKAISEAAAAGVGVANRRATPQATSWSGSPLYVLRDTAMPAVIVEPFFGSNWGESRLGELALESREYPRALLHGILQLWATNGGTHEGV